MAERSALPTWARAVFWTVVSAEWALTLFLALVVSLAMVHASVLVSIGCIPDTTVYASGFSEERWAHVEEGQSQSTVRAHLGTPLRVWSGAEGELWAYSQQRSGTDNYRQRLVRFGSDGRVLEKEETCYVD
jgi:hypothetical protein